MYSVRPKLMVVTTVGASSTAVTASVAMSTLLENGLLPPVTLASTLVPCRPALLPVWSQAR
ncbi:hypothetical protein D3C76_1617700 [compost metagenome]